ncbi:MAG: methyltransferase domain-containing protein [Elusimicrobia bacterium]|nr:methyltransferase domain-containing protein [Elusimicrobiota bacterium]
MSERVANRRAYDRWGAAYHEKRSTAAGGFYNDFLDLPAFARLLNGEVRGRDVLDLGCGSGLLTRRLRLWGARAQGADQSETMLAIARRENPGVRFTRCEASRTPFRARSFDVVASALMVHYSRNLGPIFREAARVLRPGGAWVFSFHHPFNETLTFTETGGRVRAEAAPYFHSGRYAWAIGPMKLHSHHHTFQDVFEALAEAGFVVERLLEPAPPARARKVSERDYRVTSAYPFFCAIRARTAA